MNATSLVYDGEKLIAVEITIDGEVYFVECDQSFFVGIRLGNFPRKSLDDDYTRKITELPYRAVAA